MSLISSMFPYFIAEIGTRSLSTFVMTRPGCSVIVFPYSKGTCYFALFVFRLFTVKDKQ